MLTERAGAPTGWLARLTRVSLRGKSVAVLAVPLAALFAALALIYFAEGDVANDDQMVTRFYDTRAALVALRSSLVDAEAAMNGYLAALFAALALIYFAEGDVANDDQMVTRFYD